MLYGVLDVLVGKFRYVSAGHPPLVHVDGASRPRTVRAPNFPVGIEPEPKYRETVIQLAPNERLFLYTDGLTEARNREGAQFGTERLLEVLGQPGYALNDVLDDAIQSAEKWVAPGGLKDDVSVLGIARKQAAVDDP
jgi:sigma-B regulation protein RsbU (phosphoserine phosphatase)